MRGYDFDRQKPIGDFIVDFYCKALMLAIEIDGDSHRNKGSYDAGRQAWLESQGVRFLRFDDALLRKRPQDAIRAIEGWIEREESGACRYVPTTNKAGVLRSSRLARAPCGRFEPGDGRPSRPKRLRLGPPRPFAIITRRPCHVRRRRNNAIWMAGKLVVS
jgi:hypothetical protein